MRTISWKHPLVALFVAAVVAACSSDNTPAPTDAGPEGGGKTCGNKKLDTGEKCDGTNLNGKKCTDATMGTKPSGTLSCKADCSDFDVSKCTAGGGTGGGGAGGASGSGNAGSGGAPMGGRTGKTDAGGPDAGDAGPDSGAAGSKPDSGVPDSGKKPDATTPIADAAKG